MDKIEIEARAAALTAAPAGCAFLQGVERLGLSAVAAVDPVRSFDLLGQALTEVSPWRMDHAAAVQEILTAGPRLEPLARAILAQPEAAWWFGPLDRGAQLSAMKSTGMSAPEPPIVPNRSPSEWERYAQKPTWGLYTSTEMAGTSAFLAGSVACSGDLGPLVYPVARYRLTVDPTARIFRVDGPAAWHRLCLTYPASEPGGLLGGLIVPDFAAVAREWDAVHLALGGLLTAEQVRVDGLAGATELQGWDIEQTVWLRWVFDEAIRLPDLLDPSPSQPTAGCSHVRPEPASRHGRSRSHRPGNN